MKVKEMNIDPELIRLRPINIIYVSRYRQAFRAGKDLGTIIVDKKTNCVVSGNHRVYAAKEEFGPEYEMNVELVHFKSKKELLKRFVTENASHGQPLSGFSRKRITAELLKHKATPEEIANLFGVAAKRVEEWAGISVVVIDHNGEEKQTVEPAKRGLPTGLTMSREEYKTHTKADRGIPAYSQAEQLTRWIENGWIEKNCSHTMRALEELRVALEKFFVAEKAA